MALHREGIALLIVEQNVEAILAVAHRVFVLDLGQNAFDGTPAELRATDSIRRLYLGEDAGWPDHSCGSHTVIGRVAPRGAVARPA